MPRLPLVLRLAAAAVCLPLGATVALAQATPLDTLGILAALRAEMDATRTPGVALAVVVGDRVAWATALGVESVETGQPMTVASLVRVGSVTKLVTGVTASLLAHEGALDFRAPIGQRARGLAPAIAARSLHALLTHAAGMINEAAGNGSHDDTALGERVRRWGGAQLFAPVGDVYSYSSPGYWLAGYVLEQTAATPYADLVEQRVLRPLGMRRSTFRPLAAMTWPHAQDHRVLAESTVVLRPYPDDASTWPSGSLFSNVLELSRLAAARIASVVRTS